MKTMQSFLTFFYILDQCYERCPENDLGGFLGAISPKVWEDGKPMDKAVYIDWQEQNDAVFLSEKNIINATLNFLEFYQKKFGFDFSKTKDILQNINDKEIIRRAADRAEMMYQKYGYKD